ncbi:ATPase domain-containing protein [Bordetella genomosp. 11]|uniref:ATPase domain-containing protein n=1 Tax=Bordetella genomosp. 11 TaxID=1416808 RepID=UPI000B9DEC41
MARHLARTASGIDGLDRILHGGFVEGASYIIQGRPGAGKTILCNQIAFSHAANGGKVLYVTLLAETHERLFQAMSTLDFFNAEYLGQKVTYVSVFQSLREEGLGAVVQLLRQETRRHQATLLIFDGLLNARDRAATDLDVKTFVAEVQGQAGFVGCTVLFLTSTRLDDSSPEHTMVDGVIDLGDEIFGVRTVRQLQVRKSRGSPAIGGLHQYEITRSGVTLYPRIEAVAWPLIPPAPAMLGQRVTSGNHGLDGLMCGGLPRGSITLVAGPTGAGKTTLGLHFLSAGCAEEPALHFGFFEKLALLQRKASTLGIGLSPDHVHLAWTPLAENLLDRLGHELLALVTRHRVTRLFIDGVGGFERAATHRSRLVEFFTALTNRLRATGVTTLVTWESREILDQSAKAPMEQLSGMFDNIVMMRRIETDHGPEGTIAIEKMRDSAFDSHTHILAITDSGLLIGPRWGEDRDTGDEAENPGAY